MGKIFYTHNGKRSDMTKDSFIGLFVHKSDIEILRLEAISKQISVSQIIRRELYQHIISLPKGIREMLEQITEIAQQKWNESQTKKNKITFSDFKNQVKKELKFHKLSESQIKFVLNNLKSKTNGTYNKTNNK